MVLQSISRLVIRTQGGRTGILYIPADIVKDSSFPFGPNETVLVKIDGTRLIVECGGSKDGR